MVKDNSENPGVEPGSLLHSLYQYVHKTVDVGLIASYRLVRAGKNPVRDPPN